MSVTINGDTGVSKVQDGVIVQADLASGVAGTGPAFSAYAGSTLAISNNTWTKVPCNTEEFDTNSNYDASTYRFTPAVAGYYQVSGSASIGGQSNVWNKCSIYKNGAEFKNGTMSNVNTFSNGAVVSALVYLNGSTDYVELYVIHNTGTNANLAQGQSACYFQGFLVRAA